MSTVSALYFFALMVLFGLIWNTLKAWSVDRYPKLAAAMDYVGF